MKNKPTFGKYKIGDIVILPHNIKWLTGKDEIVYVQVKVTAALFENGRWLYDVCSESLGGGKWKGIEL